MCNNITTDNDPKAKELEKKRQQQIYESFRSGPFEDIVARSEAKVILTFKKARLVSSLYNN